MYRLLNNLIVCLFSGRKTIQTYPLTRDFVVMSLATENSPSLLRSDIQLASKRETCSVLIPNKVWAQCSIYISFSKMGSLSPYGPACLTKFIHPLKRLVRYLWQVVESSYISGVRLEFMSYFIDEISLPTAQRYSSSFGGFTIAFLWPMTFHS